MAKSNELVLHSAYNPRRVEVLQEVGDVSMTRQEMADECDINLIMERYERVGGPFGPLDREPMYVDMSVMPKDLISAMNIVLDAEAAFGSLPAVVRRRFANDPVEFVEFASNPENLEDLRKWGLAPPAPVVPPIVSTAVPVPPDPPAKPA